MSWYDLDFHYSLPNVDLERNACRNPRGVTAWGEGKPWCFTNVSPGISPESWEWETCDIPVCGVDCRRGNTLGDDPSLPECNPFKEPNPRRQAVVSILSRGGVGPGDRLDLIDQEVVMATSRKDGRLLLPDLVARAAPIQILEMAFSNRHNPRVPHAFEIGEIWITQTTLDNTFVFPLIFMSETQNVGPVTWTKMGLTDANLVNADNYVAFSVMDYGGVERVSRGDELNIPNLEIDEFKLVYMSPVWNFGGDFEVALLGEVGKYVAVSNERIKGLYLSDPLTIQLGLEVCSLQL